MAEGQAGLRTRVDLLPEPTMVAQSIQMQAVVEQVRRTATIDNLPVLLLGETGVGKQEMAEFLHATSIHIHGRSDALFVDINCSGITPTLLESELFGHEKGSFTDAIKEKQGLLEIADRGSVFLDEIGDASLSFQSRLLKFLDTGRFMRVGSTQPRQSQARVIAATHQDLFRAVKKRKFREDLLFRLNVYPILIPPLRERFSDLEPLVQNCINRFNEQHGTRVSSKLGAGVVDMLVGYSWPGNVRQLFNAVERAIVNRGGEGELLVSDFTLDREKDEMPAATGSIAAPTVQAQIPDQVVSLREFRKSYLEPLEGRYIGQVLTNLRWNRRKAADILGISYKSLLNMIKGHNLEGGRNN